jgi:hypothetical protein
VTRSTKGQHRVVATDAEIDAAVVRSRLEPPVRVVEARYLRASDAVALRFPDRVELRLPRRLLQGLEHATAMQLSAIRIEGAGTGLAWPALGVAHYVPSLLEGIFGTRRWLAENGRRGGARRTPAKAAAARANGKKGGRPRKAVA